MTGKEITVLILGILLVIFIIVMKNTDNVFQNQPDDVVIGISKPPENPTQDPDPTTIFPSLENIVDIPAFQIANLVESQENLASIKESLSQAMSEQRYFTPENDNALVYLLQLKSFDVSEESLLKLLNDSENEMIEFLLHDTSVAINKGDESLLTESISRLKTLNVKSSRIDELQESLSMLKTVNRLYSEAEQLVENEQLVSEDGNSAYSRALQIKKLNFENIKVQEIIETVSSRLSAEALRAAEESYFNIAHSQIQRAQNLNPESETVTSAIDAINEIKQQRYVWLEQQITQAIRRTDIAETEKIIDQLKELKLPSLSVDEYLQQVSRMKLYGSFSPQDEFHLNNDTQLPLMTVIKSGSFYMGKVNGAKHERPVHEVNINYGFAVSKNEITVSQFRQFIEDTDYKTDTENGNSSRIYELRTGRMRSKNRIHWKHNFTGKKADDNDPVIHVSWNDAKAYVNWLSQKTDQKIRLLSEAEFEYVLRADSYYTYPWGDSTPTQVIENLTGMNDKVRINTQIRWTDGFDGYNDGHWGPAPVGSFISNPFKLNDIAGNVMEWVDDCWHDSYTRAPKDGSSWANPGCDSHVIRGGSWSSAPYEFEPSHRFKADADFSDPRLGFRIAMDLSSDS